jgi:hypothetical protein
MEGFMMTQTEATHREKGIDITEMASLHLVGAAWAAVESCTNTQTLDALELAILIFADDLASERKGSR